MKPINATRRQASLTGRDNYIMNQALLYAIACIQSLPEDRQEFSNMLDMCSLALADRSPFTSTLIVGVEAHVGQTINLWPMDDDCYSAEQLLQKADLSEDFQRDRMRRSAWLVSRGDAVSDDPAVIEIAAEMARELAELEAAA